MREKDAARLRRYEQNFEPTQFLIGLHIFCDGASIPNPGAGGWGIVVYRDGVEIACQAGGDTETTNNAMELTGLLVAIEKASCLCAKQPVTIWCDSQYCVEGANIWLTTWKARGWNKRKLSSPNRADGEIKNLELWKAIDEALGDQLSPERISIRWVKGHCGVIGNLRADQMADGGRKSAIADRTNADDPLLQQFIEIMGAE